MLKLYIAALNKEVKMPIRATDLPTKKRVLSLLTPGLYYSNHSVT